jgi:hypothetical protein
MKKKIGSSKPIKKYAMGGSKDGPGDGKVKQEWYNPRNKNGAVGKTIEADTLGYSAGAKKFPATITTSRGTSSGTIDRNKVDDMIKNPKKSSFGVKAKNGGSVGKKPKMAMGGSLKNVPTDKVGLSKLPTAVRNKMGYKKIGGSVGKSKKK